MKWYIGINKDSNRLGGKMYCWSVTGVSGVVFPSLLWRYRLFLGAHIKTFMFDLSFTAANETVFFFCLLAWLVGWLVGWTSVAQMTKPRVSVFPSCPPPDCTIQEIINHPIPNVRRRKTTTCYPSCCCVQINLYTSCLQTDDQYISRMSLKNPSHRAVFFFFIAVSGGLRVNLATLFC